MLLAALLYDRAVRDLSNDLTAIPRPVESPANALSSTSSMRIANSRRVAHFRSRNRPASTAALNTAPTPPRHHRSPPRPITARLRPRLADRGRATLAIALIEARRIALVDTDASQYARPCLASSDYSVWHQRY